MRLWPKRKEPMSFVDDMIFDSDARYYREAFTALEQAMATAVGKLDGDGEQVVGIYRGEYEIVLRRPNTQ